MKTIKQVLLWLMGLVYIAAGANHFLSPDFYLPMMPRYLPLHPELVFLSGVAEIAVGLGVLIPQTRVWAAWGTIAVLLAVYPANIHVALNNVPIGDPPEALGAMNYVRLPFQFVLIAWAWWYTRPEEKVA